MNATLPANLLLIDGALRPQALAALYRQVGAQEILPLYRGTRWQALQELGPILVKPQSREMLAQWPGSPQARTDSSLLYSNASLEDVAAHLRHFIAPPTRQGSQGLLRFANPRITVHWLDSFAPQQLARVLGPIEHWWVSSPNHGWEEPPDPAWRTFSRNGPTPAWTDSCARLEEPQEVALEKARLWKFEERLYQWLRTRNEHTFANSDARQIGHWLKQTLDSGQAWGLHTEQALVTWAEACADWGNDFVQQAEGPYLRWLTLEPEHARLAPELRLEAFDQHQQHIAGLLP